MASLVGGRVGASRCLGLPLVWLKTFRRVSRTSSSLPLSVPSTVPHTSKFPRTFSGALTALPRVTVNNSSR